MPHLARIEAGLRRARAPGGGDSNPRPPSWGPAALSTRTPSVSRSEEARANQRNEHEDADPQQRCAPSSATYIASCTWSIDSCMTSLTHGTVFPAVDAAGMGHSLTRPIPWGGFFAKLCVSMVNRFRDASGVHRGVTNVRKLASVLGVGVGAAALVLTAVGPSTAAPAAYSCPVGNVCFYSGTDGSGQRCNWQVDDPDWRGGSTVCSWSGSSNVRSVYNNAYSDVAYYLGANYSNYVGCTVVGDSGNLTGSGYKIRSHDLGGC